MHNFKTKQNEMMRRDWIQALSEILPAPAPEQGAVPYTKYDNYGIPVKQL